MGSPWLRRLVTVPVVLAALPLALLAAPLWVPVALAADAAQRLFRFPTLRLGLMAVVYLAHQWACLAAFAALSLKTVGRRSPPVGDGPDPVDRGPATPVGRQERRLAPYRRVEAWWARSLVRWGRRLLGVHFDLPADMAAVPAGGFMLLSRHASMADALLPLYLVTGLLDRFAHYVMKRELRFDPTLDLYGHRLDNHFIARTGPGGGEAAALTALAQRSLPGSVLVIFPEGTYASPQRRARVRRSLARRGQPDLVELADGLDHLLPPKPAGTLALLAGRPGIDVVVLGHVGLEGVSNLAGLRRRLPLTEPVTVRWWHHPRATVPAGEEEAIAWLNDRWRSLDRWVDDVMGRRTGDRPQGETP